MARSGMRGNQKSCSARGANGTVCAKIPATAPEAASLIKFCSLLLFRLLLLLQPAASVFFAEAHFSFSPFFTDFTRAFRRPRFPAVLPVKGLR